MAEWREGGAAATGACGGIDIEALSKQPQTVFYSVLLLKSLNLTQAADRVNSNCGASVATAERDAVCPADPPSK